jgi:hypothetical protein
MNRRGNANAPRVARTPWRSTVTAVRTVNKRASATQVRIPAPSNLPPVTVIQRAAPTSAAAIAIVHRLTEV